MVAMGFLFRFASRCNAPLTSNDFNKQSQISSLLAGLRKGSKIAGVAASLPNNPNISMSAVCVLTGENNTSISLISPAKWLGASTCPKGFSSSSK
jgi:hypothetical protein